MLYVLLLFTIYMIAYNSMQLRKSFLGRRCYIYIFPLTEIQLDGLNSCKSVDPDNLHPRVLKEAAECIVEPI